MPHKVRGLHWQSRSRHMQTEHRILRIRRELNDTVARAEGLRTSVRYLEERVSKLRARSDALGPQASGPTTRGLAEEIRIELDSIKSARKELGEAVERADKLHADLRQAESGLMEFGWQVADARDRQRGIPVPGGSEREALEIISEAGEHARIGTVRKRMGLSNVYARMLCTSLGRKGFIDVASDGTCRLATKGEKAIRKLSEPNSS